MAQSDAQRLERLMRRHAQGKLSDADLIRAQEQMLGGGTSGLQNVPTEAEQTIGDTGGGSTGLRGRLNDLEEQVEGMFGSRQTGQGTKQGQQGPRQPHMRPEPTTDGIPPGEPGEQRTQLSDPSEQENEGSSGKQIAIQFITFILVALGIAASRIFGN